MESHTTDSAPTRVRWFAVIFFVSAVLDLLFARWLMAALFLANGLVFLKYKLIERQPKRVQYLIVATLAALAVAAFVKLIIDLKARG